MCDNLPSLLPISLQPGPELRYSPIRVSWLVRFSFELQVVYPADRIESSRYVLEKIDLCCEFYKGISHIEGNNFGIHPYPGPAQGTFSLQWKTRFCFRNSGFMYIDSILVGKICVCAFPGSYTTTTVSQEQLRWLNPTCTKPVQEVCLTSYFALVEVSIAQFPNIDLIYERCINVCATKQLTVSW
jgi:hypothetical protein